MKKTVFTQKLKKLFLAGIFLCTTISVTQAQIITTVAGNGVDAYTGDGSAATSASVSIVSGVLVDSAGNIYIGDYDNNAIRKVSPAGIISTIAGNGTAGFNGDGGPASAALLNAPLKLTFDREGNLLFSDFLNQRVRKISTTGIISTIAGTGTAGYNGDGIAATNAELDEPSGLAVDTAGNIYIADYANFRVRKIATSGIISTIAGTGTQGSTGDGGPAAAAELNGTFGLALDDTENLYLADAGNHKIRKIATTGIISTFAGTGTAGFSGDNIPAVTSELNNPAGVSVDYQGNVYISDQFNFRIRKVDTAGIITTLAGTGTEGFSGDGGPATAAMVSNTNDLYLDNHTGVLYLCDDNNARVREITAVVAPLAINDLVKNTFSTYPNPAENKVSVELPNGSNKGTLMLWNELGQSVMLKQIDRLQNCIDVSTLRAGIYFISLTCEQQKYYGKLVKQ
jgi:hypothetical protein